MAKSKIMHLRLTPIQESMLVSIRDHVALTWPECAAGPSLVEIVRQAIHTEHSRIFGEKHHKLTLAGGGG